MSHMCGRHLLNKEKRRSKTTEKKCCLANGCIADCKNLSRYKSDGQCKMKQLKTRRERREMRSRGRDTTETKSYPHHCCCQTRKYMASLHNCCQGGWNSRKDALLPKVVSASQEPSIITDNRLIGHHGLFNHEVKSVDIQRLLSEQEKQEKGRSEAQQHNQTISRPPSASYIPFPVCINDDMSADTEEVVPFKEKVNPATNIHTDFHEKEKNINTESDPTPGQRPQPQSDLSSESYKSIVSSKRSSSDEAVNRSKKVNSVLQENSTDCQQTPAVDRIIVKTRKSTHLTPKNQEPHEHQKRASGLSPNPLLLSSSPTADIERKQQDPDYIATCVTAMAARLCDCLQFPRLRRRNLLAESRVVLLKALTERHGSHLQKTLLKEHLGFHTDPANPVWDSDQEPTLKHEDKRFPAANTVSQPCFDTGNDVMGSMPLNRRSSLQQNQSRKWAAEWVSPVDTSASHVDDILRPYCSPQFCMDSVPFGASENAYLFSSSSASFWGEEASTSQQWDNKPKNKEPVIFDSFENTFMKLTRAVEESSCEQHFSGSNVHPLFAFQPQLPDKHSAEPMYVSPEQNPFIPDTIAPPFADQSSHFQTSSQSRHSSACPPLSSYNTDIRHHPPSPMLDRSRAMPSPHHWSFPPLKLY